MNKRIILFGPLPPPYGGVAIFMNALVEHWDGSQVRVWTYGGANNNKRARFIRHRLLGTVPALLSEARGARILDASHFHLEHPNALLLAAWLLLKHLLGFEWYKNVHDGSLPKRHADFSLVQRWLFRRAVDSIDQFVVVSDELRRWLQDVVGVNQPVVVVPGLLPSGSSHNEGLSKTTSFLSRYLAAEKQVCSIGVFYPAYGFLDVALAVEELRRQTGRDIGLLLLDGGFVRDEVYRKKVLRDRSWITVVEELPHSEISQILKQSDVFVRAVAQEGYGISRIEALWAGIPVIATRSGETRGMLLFDFGHVEQLVGQLQAVLFSTGPKEPEPWAARYRKEAEENLQKLATVLGIEP